MAAASAIETLINKSISQGDSLDKVTRKIFLLFPTHAFNNEYDLQLELLSEISNFLDVPISSIHIVGSAKTGISFVKGTNFSPETSDIDIAIVDHYLFFKKFEHSYKESNGWQLNTFSVRGNPDKTKQRRSEFLDYLHKGIFRPEKMPNSSERADWINFFNLLSVKYANYCNGITAWVYAGEHFLTSKQQSAVEKFLSNKGEA